MAKIMIGGVVRTTAPMNFVAWPIAWPHMGKLTIGANADHRAIFTFLACAVVMAEPGAEDFSDDEMAKRVDDLALELRRKFRMPDMAGLQAALPAIMEENGFKAGEGKGAPGNAMATSSTAISTGLSAASSPASDQLTGT